jgi:hypothetical protein
MSQRYVFLSYSRRDDDFAHTLYDHLIDAGIRVWIDSSAIEDGSRWLQNIQQGVENASALVVVMSRSARESEWVERETLLALQLRRPIFIALIEDIPLPLHLINRQYTDFRDDYERGLGNLIQSLERVLATPLQTTTPRPLPAAHAPTPNEANFFEYLKQMNGENDIHLLARDMYHWAKTSADSVEFGGKRTPCFHARVKTNSKNEVTVFSVLAYLRNPSVQIPFDYLQKYPPFKEKTTRLEALHQLNAMLPESEQFDDERAGRRPTVPLTVFDSADRLETFKELVDDVIQQIRQA